MQTQQRACTSLHPSPAPEVSQVSRGRSRSRQALRPWRFRDPRATSTQSLHPSDTLNYVHSQSSGLGSDDGSLRHAYEFKPRTEKPRRRLLVIYIHGYMGDTSSFKSFPAHVHGYLTERLRDTHTVHTKIYPRYKTYRALQIATDEFGDWLDPNVDDDTDVVLVGHSMGGLVAADIVLLPPNDLYTSSTYPFRHRILGTITCDSPFLGLDPRIAVTGIKSLVSPGKEADNKLPPQPPATLSALSPRPSSSSQAEASPSLSRVESSAQFVSTAQSSTPASESRPSSQLQSQVSSSSHIRRPTIAALLDPNFNPSYSNDAYHPARSFWAGLWNFSKKYNHQPGSIAGAGLMHVYQHFQYAWCLVDWGQLTKRYARLRELENPGNRFGTRVRWVNYYTVCSGRNSPKAAEMMREETGIRGTLVQATDVFKVGGKAKSSGGSSGTTTQPEPQSHHMEVQQRNTMVFGDSAGTPRVSVEQWVDGTVESVLGWYDPSSQSSSLSEGERPETPGSVKRRRLPESQMPSFSTVDASTQTSFSASSATLDHSIAGDSTLSTKKAEREKEKAKRQKEKAKHQQEKAERQQQKKAERKEQEAERKKQKAERERQQKAESKEQKAERQQREKAERKEQKAESERQQKAEREEQKAQRQQQKAERKQQKAAKVAKDQKGFEKELDRLLREEIEQVEREVQFQAHLQPEPEFDTESETPSGRMYANSDAIREEADEISGTESKGRNRRFCIVPSSISRTERGQEGQSPDPAWIKVDMGDVDEVAAHCGLFLQDASHYNDFLEDVCERIVGWVEEAS